MRWAPWIYWMHRRVRCARQIADHREQGFADAGYCLDRHMPYYLGVQ